MSQTAATTSVAVLPVTIVMQKMPLLPQPSWRTAALQDRLLKLHYLRKSLLLRLLLPLLHPLRQRRGKQLL